MQRRKNRKINHTTRRKGSNFAGVNERGLLATVGYFGEELATAILKGERVSDDEDYDFADVVHHGLGIAIEVKMSNQRHPHRPMPQQIKRLHTGVAGPNFLYSHGVYFLICYRGVIRTRKNDGKSMLWSRKISPIKRKLVIAQELQYIYVVDVEFLHYLAEKEPTFLRNGAIVSSEGRSNRETVLYLNRTTLGGFLKRTEESRLLLERALGRHKWCVATRQVNLCFTGEAEKQEESQGQLSLPLRRTIPVYFIGKKSTGNAITSLLDGRNVEVPIVEN